MKNELVALAFARAAIPVLMCAGFFFCGAPLVFAAEQIPKPAPKIPGGAWADALKTHPRLFGPKAYLESLAGEKPSLYQAVKSNDSLVTAGITNAVEGIPADKVDALVKSAMADVAKGVTNAHQDTWIALDKVATTYDQFYDAVSPADRKAMIDWLNAHLAAYTDDENAFHNSTLSKILCYLHVAYATWGENPRAKDFRDYAIVKLYEGKVVPVLNEFGAGGGFTECGWYTRHSLWHLVQALELARRFENYDGFQKAPRFFYERLAYEMLQPYPGTWVYGSQRYAVEGDGSLVFGGHSTYPRNTRMLLANYFRGSELSGYIASRHYGPANSLAKMNDFLYEEEPAPAGTVDTFPLAHLAAGIGKVYARSDWTDDASWLRFECGDYWVGHQHFEVGNFEIFRYEPLATESGEYVDYGSNHAVNWLLRTIAHNCILVYEPGETWTQMRDGGRNKYANDGGQTKKWEWTVGSLPEWMAKRDTFTRGKIVAYENRPEYTYVAGDCTKAYVPSKMSLWIRQIVFVRPHAFVVFDRVVSAKPEYAKTWLLHSRTEPAITGAAFTVKDGKGSLFAETLLPREASVTKIYGNTYGGQTFDEPESAQTPAAARWRVEVKPARPAGEDLFLHVMRTDSARPAKLVERGGMVGVDLGDAEVLFSANVGGTLRLGDKEFPLEARVKAARWED